MFDAQAIGGLEAHDLDLRVLLFMAIVLGFSVAILASRIFELRRRIQALAAWAYDHHRWTTEVLMTMTEPGKHVEPPPQPKGLER